MSAQDETLQTLRNELSKLKDRVKELDEENCDLRDFARGIYLRNRCSVEEWLALRRHKRNFAYWRAKHPMGKSAKATDVLGAAPIVLGIAMYAGSVLRTGLIARCFCQACTQLMAQSPWNYGGRNTSTFPAHENVVRSF